MNYGKFAIFYGKFSFFFVYLLKIKNMTTATAEKNFLKEIPNSPLNEDKILNIISLDLFDRQSIAFIKKFTKFNDHDISDLLKISIRTLRNYTLVGAMLKTKLEKEHWIKILSLYKHGEEVFGDKDLFIEWLNENNYERLTGSACPFIFSPAPDKHRRKPRGHRYHSDCHR